MSRLRSRLGAVAMVVGAVAASLVGGALDTGARAAVAPTVPSPAGSVPAAGGAVEVCRASNPAISENSGLASSRTDPTVLWAHNDSGDGTRFFALDAGTCAVRLVIRLVGTQTVDAEDIALAPGPDGKATIWLADIGDNSGARQSVSLYLFPEPPVPAAPPAGTLAQVVPLTLSRIELRYPDGPHDAEALLVPATGDAVVVTKQLGGGQVFSLPPGAAQATGPVELVAGPKLTLPPAGEPRGPAVGPAGAFGDGLVTGGDVSPDGRQLVVRTYPEAWAWSVPSQGGLVAAFDASPQRVALPAEPQGEAVAYSADGASLLTLSEGRDQPLLRLPAPPLVSAPTVSSAGTPSPQPTAAPASGRRFSSVSTPVLAAAGVAVGLLLVGGLAGWRARRRRRRDSFLPVSGRYLR